MWYILENEQHSYDLSERLIRAISGWQISDDSDDVEDLLDQGAEVHRLHGTLLPLHCACMVNDPDVVVLLLQRGAQVNAFDGYNRSALHHAAELGLDCIELLIENGAELDITDRNGDTPLHWAAFKNRVQSLIVLLNHGADVNALDFNHESPLSWAAKKFSLEAVEVLLNYNAIPDSVDLNGMSPLAYAVRMLANRMGDEDGECVIQLLIGALGQFDLRDSDGQPPSYITLNNNLWALLSPYCENPRPLKELCRFVVRSLMGPSYLPSHVSELPVPSRLKEYILLQEIMMQK